MEDKPILWNTMNCPTTVRSCMVYSFLCKLRAKCQPGQLREPSIIFLVTDIWIILIHGNAGRWCIYQRMEQFNLDRETVAKEHPRTSIIHHNIIIRYVWDWLADLICTITLVYDARLHKDIYTYA